MTVKRYTPTQCCEHDGTYVNYSDYQKLVAENAALKLCTSNQDKAVEHWNSWADEVDKIKSYPETPATDDAIVEIREQSLIIGVDFVRNMLIDYVEREAGPNRNVPGLIRAAEKCVELSDSLRAGRRG